MINKAERYFAKDLLRLRLDMVFFCNLCASGAEGCSPLRPRGCVLRMIKNQMEQTESWVLYKDS